MRIGTLALRYVAILAMLAASVLSIRAAEAQTLWVVLPEGGWIGWWIRGGW